MTFGDFFLLKEANRNTALISIDIQPSYITACKYIMHDYIDFLNDFRGPIIIFWNGEDLGMESKHEMIDFLLEWGISEEVLDQIIWREKVYAFFRPWMDSGMDRRNLIKAIRYMVSLNKNDSRDISEDQWKTLFGEEWPDVESIIYGDSINIPDISLAELKTYSGCYLCGGGTDECLSEFRFLLEAFNIRYKIIKSLTY